jgi:hypothetical protein
MASKQSGCAACKRNDGAKSTEDGLAFKQMTHWIDALLQKDEAGRLFRHAVEGVQARSHSVKAALARHADESSLSFMERLCSSMVLQKLVRPAQRDQILLDLSKLGHEEADVICEMSRILAQRPSTSTVELILLRIKFGLNKTSDSRYH